MAAVKRLVLTFDAFGTLFRPKEPVHKQYADMARRHGLSGLTDEQVRQNFKQAFNHAQMQYPNYGRRVGMGSTKWWSNVIQSTFQSVTMSENLPPQLIPDLLQRFAGQEGYEAYPDTLKFLNMLRACRGQDKPLGWDDLRVGVISNSDERVPSILTSLGFRVSSQDRARPQATGAPEFSLPNDIDFVVLSYDVGFEKPDRRIFDAAREAVGTKPREPNLTETFLHVGDDWERDYLGAIEAGWEAIFLSGHGRTGMPNEDIEVLMSQPIEDLGGLAAYLSEVALRQKPT